VFEEDVYLTAGSEL